MNEGIKAMFDCLEALGRLLPDLRGYYARSTGGVDWPAITAYLATEDNGAAVHKPTSHSGDKPATVGVKPLEWSEGKKRDHVGNRWWRGYSAFEQFSYRIHHDRDEGGINYVLEGRNVAYLTLEDAQAAAQADYETRICSALSSPASGERDAPAGYVLVPVEPTEGMLAAGMDSLAESTGEPLSFIVRDVLFAYRAMVAALRMEGK